MPSAATLQAAVDRAIDAELTARNYLSRTAARLALMEHDADFGRLYSEARAAREKELAKNDPALANLQAGRFHKKKVYHQFTKEAPMPDTLTVRQKIHNAVKNRALRVFAPEIARGDLSRAAATARYLKTDDGSRAYRAANLAGLNVTKMQDLHPEVVEILKQPFVKSGAGGHTLEQFPACSSALLSLKS